MTLSPRLDSVEALYRKLERESVRAFHHPNLTHKSDHFYNFCITAHSLRDHLLERLGKLSQAERQPFVDAWQQDSNLIAVAEIANTAKHFVLRTRTGQAKSVKTRKVGRASTTVYDFLLAPDGTMSVKKRTGVPTIAVKLEGGQRLEMYRFMYSVLEYWKGMLAAHSIKVRRQSWSSLHGKAT